jgi:hypothetical protein
VLPFGLAFFLALPLAGGEEDDDRPNVKERDSEDARAVPKPEPFRVIEGWSGEPDIEREWA